MILIFTLCRSLQHYSSYLYINMLFLQTAGSPSSPAALSSQMIFSEFDPEPLASASIAQVHRARLRSNGKVVAVKAGARFFSFEERVKMKCGAVFCLFLFLLFWLQLAQNDVFFLRFHQFFLNLWLDILLDLLDSLTRTIYLKNNILRSNKNDPMSFFHNHVSLHLTTRSQVQHDGVDRIFLEAGSPAESRGDHRRPGCRWGHCHPDDSGRAGGILGCWDRPVLLDLRPETRVFHW